MKIGILTHHYINNFGAFLQTYALQSYLRQSYPDADVEVIDLVNRKHALINTLGWFRYRPGQDSPRRWLQKARLPGLFRQARREYLRLSPRVRTAAQINLLGYDAIIVGSDEVWNYADGKSVNPIKFGEGLNCPRLIAYAPSVGQAALLPDIPDAVRRGLPRFARLSARDALTADLVARCGLRAQRVLDPTFLAPIPTQDVPVQRPYLLFYYCERLPQAQWNVIRAYAKAQGLAIYGAGESGGDFDADTIALTPFQWAGLFAHAEAVVTGTFHGVVFSLLNRRPFACYMTNPSRAAKVTSLLEEFSLQNRRLTPTDDPVAVLTRPLDAQALERAIATRLADSRAFLDEALGAR